MSIGVLTIRGDIHAHAIRHELRMRHGVDLHLIEVDRLSAVHRVDWRLQPDNPECRIWCDNTWIALNDLDVLWWRRSRSQQEFDGVHYPPEQEDIINNDCRSSLLGGLVTCFEGYWLSHPHATERAGNKLYQLSVANRMGFRVPKTLISQDPESVQSFVSGLPGGRAIAKTVAGGGKGMFLFTQFVTESDLLTDASITVCPAIYQEYIAGDTHIRLNCFGDASYAGKIVSPELDWRPNLDVPVTAWDVPQSVHTDVRATLDAMGLEMGVVDLKLTPEGDLVWLEVNPQGQFLFLEPLTEIPLTKIFADYLVSRIGKKQRVQIM